MDKNCTGRDNMKLDDTRYNNLYIENGNLSNRDQG